MKKTAKDLIDAGFSISEIIAAVKELRSDEVIRCECCNRRMADVEEGEIVIKCRCGEFHKML